MASEKIIVYIDPGQLAAQKNNNYSLFLAKKVNGVFTVIWQSMGPVATVTNPISYEYNNTFIIQVPSYQVNYGSINDTGGPISFNSAGEAVSIDLGQTVTLDKNGIFGTSENGGPTGVIRVINSLEGNPHELLADNNGNPVFFNQDSGMDIGDADLTPIDEYQLWFDNFQQTGTMIAHNVSNAGLVVFSGEDSQTISYNAAGVWESGPLNVTRRTEAEMGNGLVIVAATFTTALTAAAVTYLTSKLVSKFAGDLRPTSVKVAVGSLKLELTFQKPNAEMQTVDVNVYEQAVENALVAARKDPKSGLAGEHWRLSEPQIEVQV